MYYRVAVWWGVRAVVAVRNARGSGRRRRLAQDRLSAGGDRLVRADPRFTGRATEVGRGGVHRDLDATPRPVPRHRGQTVARSRGYPGSSGGTLSAARA